MCKCLGPVRVRCSKYSYKNFFIWTVWGAAVLVCSLPVKNRKSLACDQCVVWIAVCFVWFLVVHCVHCSVLCGFSGALCTLQCVVWFQRCALYITVCCVVLSGALCTLQCVVWFQWCAALCHCWSPWRTPALKSRDCSRLLQTLLPGSSDSL